MDIATRIIEARDSGVVIAAVRDYAVSGVEEAALQFELFATGSIYHEVSAEEACRVLGAVLQRDMAYGLQLMAPELALALAEEFVAALAGDGTKFYTNGEFGRVDGRPAWNPATGATFDTGILAVTRTRVACVWVMDED